MKTKNRIWLCLLIGLILILINSCKKDEESTDIIIDKDGNVYTSVTIDTQVWMVENLKATKYNDGTAIPNVTDDTEWANLTTGAYCWYNNDINKPTYGALYNWYAVNTGKLCPTNWHVPSDDEWTTLTDFLGGESIAGGKLKEAGTTHWGSPNTGATNESGFTALPCGSRNMGGAYGSIGYWGEWWSSTDIYIEFAGTFYWFRGMYYDASNVNRIHTTIKTSIRNKKEILINQLVA